MNSISQAKVTAHPFPDRSAVKILLADADGACRTPLKEMLEVWGHETAIASDGQEVLSCLAGSNPPKLLLLDWQMPGLEGMQLCRQIREKNKLALLHILLMMPANEPDSAAHCLEAGPDDYIGKPLDCHALRARIQVGCRILGLQARLREQERLQGALDMAGIVCHEMNQPLQVVLGMTQLLLMDASPAHPQYEMLTGIKEGVDWLGKVTRKVMGITHTRTRNYLEVQKRIIAPDVLPGW